MSNKALILYTASDAARNGFLSEQYEKAFARFGADASLCIIDGMSPAELVKAARGCTAVVDRTRDASYAEALEAAGIPVSNPSVLRRAAGDKLATYRLLSPLVPMLETVEVGVGFAPPLPYPFVIKPRDGHGGEGVELIKDESDYEKYRLTYGTEGKLAQPVATETGRDMRVYVIGGRPAAAMLRRAREGIRSNFCLGGEASFVPLDSLSQDEWRLISRVCAALPLDYAGVDIMHDHGRAVLNEIEDPVGARMLYTMTDIDPALMQVAHVLKKCGMINA